MVFKSHDVLYSDVFINVDLCFFHESPYFLSIAEESLAVYCQIPVTDDEHVTAGNRKNSKTYFKFKCLKMKFDADSFIQYIN